MRMRFSVHTGAVLGTINTSGARRDLDDAATRLKALGETQGRFLRIRHTVVIRSLDRSAGLQHPFSASVRSNSSRRMFSARVTPRAPPAASP